MRKQVTPNRRSKLAILKNILLVGIIVFIATFIQIYWAMGKYGNQMSSACLECWFLEEVFYMSFLTAVFLSVIFYFTNRIKNIYIKIMIQFLLLVCIWIFWNYTVFVDRESSWSTYLFHEEMYYVIHFSVLPVLVLSILTQFFLNYYRSKMTNRKPSLEKEIN